MKKLTTIILLFVFASADAQRGGNNEGPSFVWSGDGMGNHIPTIYGFSGGVSMSNVGGYGTLTAPTFSAFLSVPVNSWLRIRPEMGYTAMGSENATNRFRADYFFVSVVPSFQPAKNLYVLTGFQTAMILSANQTTGTTKTNTRNQMHEQDFAFVGGIEYMPGLIGVMVRYQYGFKDNGLGEFNRGFRAGINIKL